MADKRKGYIAIWRCIEDSAIWSNETMAEPYDKRSAWISLLLKANHKEKVSTYKNVAITIRRGQCMVAIRKLAEKWGWSKSKVERYINLLVNLGMVYKSSTPIGTLLTIVKYDDYQNGWDISGDANRDTDEDGAETWQGHGRGLNNNVNNDNTLNNVNKKGHVPFSMAYKDVVWE